MPKGIMVVQSNPSDPAREDEFNNWYTHTHLPQVCSVPGFVAARRYKVCVDGAGASPPEYKYLAVYDIDADDIAGAVAEFRARSAAGEVSISGALQMDPPPVVTLYELVE